MLYGSRRGGGGVGGCEGCEGDIGSVAVLLTQQQQDTE